MSGSKDDMRNDGVRRLEKKAADAFEASVRGLDAETRSRLNRGRQRALAELGIGTRFRPWLQWVPAAGVAAVVALAIFTWSGRPPADTAPAVADFEILLNTDDLEMLEELEFYSWIELDEGEGANGNVG
ncbi:MAG: hypothetical protein OEW35_16095 [Gammaproteobacteria bacterium]|nr:hypothetical protein [Gammaproteobacteria bacterium]MDH4256170.1 hypothetical protein [Gammaproteobacteria bacterium]MDH5311591.1 hypothetical protein [Gammaproteobacteria bacterium]